MKKSIIIVCSLIVVVSMTIISVALLSNRNNEDTNETTDMPTQNISETTNNVAPESEVNEEPLSDIIDNRAQGTDTSTDTIVVPEADYDIEQYYENSEDNPTVEQLSEITIDTISITEAPSDYVVSTAVDDNSYHFSYDYDMNILYSVDTILSRNNLANMDVVRCHMPYNIQCDQFWLITDFTKVYTLVLYNNTLYLLDQGIPYDESVREA